MGLIEGIILGIVQGLTEFLPISSTAHLTLAGKLLGTTGARGPEAWTATMAVMQLGTTAAVLIYFRNDIRDIILSVVHDLRVRISGDRTGGSTPVARPPIGENTRLAFLITLGTVPVVAAGLLAEDFIKGPFTKDTRVIASSLIGLAIVLWIAEKTVRHARTMADKRWPDGLVIGAAQALALIPGASRSGTTIAAGLFLGFTRESAARFSFLLSVPAVVASGGYEAAGLEMPEGELLPMLAAMLVAGVTGYAAIGFLLSYLKKRTMLVFIIYRIALGTLLLLAG